MEESYNDALEKYYSLKNEYQTEKNKQIAKIRNENVLSVKEKRSMFSALKFKCVNCKRPVGTIFSNNFDDKTEERHLRAICGDSQKPCNLLIDINVGYCELANKTIISIEKMIDDVKVELIKSKNNMLFGYITEEKALAKFELFKTDINELTASLELETLFYVNNTLNKNRIDGMRNSQSNVYTKIDEHKKLIKSYAESNNTQFVKTAVTNYIHELKPALDVLRNYKYSNSRVEYDEAVSEKSYLIQEVNSLINVENCYGDIGVVSYITEFTGVQPLKNKIAEEPKVPKEKKVKEPKVPKEKVVKEPKVPKEKKVKEPKVPKEKKAKLGGNLDYETDDSDSESDSSDEDTDNSDSESDSSSDEETDGSDTESESSDEE